MPLQSEGASILSCCYFLFPGGGANTQHFLVIVDLDVTISEEVVDGFGAHSVVIGVECKRIILSEWVNCCGIPGQVILHEGRLGSDRSLVPSLLLVPRMSLRF